MFASWANTLFSNRSNFNALASFTSEASLLAGPNQQPVIPAFFMDGGFGRTFRLTARGVLSSTGTPTYLFTLRMGTTSGSAYLSGTTLGATAALTTSSGVSNKLWTLEHIFSVFTPGIGTGNCTLSGNGTVRSAGGLASPFEYAMAPGGGESATWTSTVDTSLAQYLNLSATCSANSSSNTIQCLQLILEAIN